MRFDETSPKTLAAMAGFDDAVADLRAKHELEVFAGPPTHSIELYDQLWLAGALDCYSVTDDHGNLAAFAAVLLLPMMRRNTKTYQLDVSWSRGARSGAALWTGLRRVYRDHPLLVVAPIGGPLDQHLTKTPGVFATHRVHLIGPPRRRADRGLGENPAAT